MAVIFLKNGAKIIFFFEKYQNTKKNIILIFFSKKKYLSLRRNFLGVSVFATG